MKSLCVALMPNLVALVSGVACAQDGSDYEYAESVSVSGATRTIVANICPNHPYYNLNPNYAVKEYTTYTIPASPTYVGAAADSSTSSAHIDLSEKGAAVGIFFNGAQLFSPYGGSKYGKVTSWVTSASYTEGQSFDMCGCHGSSTSAASYHCHIPPACLLQQLGQTDAAHSPQIGWAFDGFPVYGPRGTGGVMMKTCSSSGGTYGTDVCTDECGGYYSDDGSIDKFVYRYHMLGEYGDGTSCSNAACPSPTRAYYPSSPVCYRGCCPAGVTCHSSVSACPGSGTLDGYTASYTAEVPTVNGLSLASGLPTNSGGCACSDLTCTSTCSDSDWSGTARCDASNTCASTATASASVGKRNLPAWCGVLASMAAMMASFV